MKNLFAKISAVMKDVEYLKKDDTVKAGAETYKAITEEKVTEAVGQAMRRHGLVIYPVEMTERREDMQVIRSSGKQAIDRLATVNVKYKIADVESGESDIIVSAGTGIDTQDKAIGKAMTYAYKYALLRTFAIPTGEDPDKIASDDVSPAGKAASGPNSAPAQQKASGQAKPPQTPPAASQAGQAGNAPAVLTKAQLLELTDLCTDHETGGKDPEMSARLQAIYTELGYAKASEIKQSDFTRVKDALMGFLLPDDL